jgi:eukaryotic-like serine/threonine-protein kinase
VAAEDQQFGKYRLVAKIAAGGMAEIFKARFAAAKGITKQVVIKRILPHYAANPAFVQMFTNEAKIAMDLSHGNIAQVFDFGEIDGDWFLAMEFVDGHALSQVVKRARKSRFPFFPTPLAVLVMIETLKALHYAHTRVDSKNRPLNIVHRDVSPQNVLVSYEGQVKLVDFGIAKAKYGQENTQSGSIKGKYIYFSPEQARGKELDARTDVFACGAMLYELLTGQLPFQGKLIEVLGKITKGQFAPPTELNPEIPPALERIILKAMALNVADRYQSAGEYEHALSSWLHNNAPGFSFDTLAQFMAMLFEQELVSDGRSVKLTKTFVEQASFWQRDDVLPDQDESQSKTAPGRLPETHRKKGPFGLPRPVIFGLPLLAVLGGLTGAFLFGRVNTFDMRVTSKPEGASVRIDGTSAAGATPLVIESVTADKPHLVQVDLVGMKPWSMEIRGSARSITAVHADLEREVRPQIEVADEPVAVDAGVADAEPKDKSLDALAPVEALYPQASFSLLARRHVKQLEKSNAARIDLDPNQTYKVKAEGRISFGGMVSDIFIEACPYMLSGPKVQAQDAFGILGKQPMTFTGVSRLYAFVTDLSVHDNTGALIIRIESKSGEKKTMLVDGKEHTVMPETGERMSVKGISALNRYELTLRDGKVPARTRARGKPGKVLFGQTTGFNIVEGAAKDAFAHRVMETGKKYIVKGSSMFWMWFPDDDLSDNEGSIEVEIAPIAGNEDTWENKGKKVIRDLENKK